MTTEKVQCIQERRITVLDTNVLRMKEKLEDIDAKLSKIVNDIVFRHELEKYKEEAKEELKKHREALEDYKKDANDLYASKWVGTAVIFVASSLGLAVLQQIYKLIFK